MTSPKSTRSLNPGCPRATLFTGVPVPARCASLVAAIGRAKMLNASHVKPGAIVIDVGKNRDEHGKLCGDVDFAAVESITVTAGIARLSVR